MDYSAHLDARLTPQHRTARCAELERAVGLMVDAREAKRYELAEHTAPRGLVQIAADPEHGKPVMLPAGDALARLAAQHLDEMDRAKALAGAVNGG